MRVVASRLGHRFNGAPWLFRHLDFAFEEGLSYALTGNSGSGKSTLLAVVAGWVSAQEGQIKREGVEKVNWVFQNSYGMPRRTAIDHVILPLLAQGRGRREAAETAMGLLDRFRIEHLRERQFRALSGGEAQRLMFARAIAAQPQLLLVDEPTAQLDAVTSRLVNEVITELSAEGRIVLVASHDSGTIASCDVQLDLSRYSVASDG